MGSPAGALRVTMLTSGRAVYFSAVCVVCGLIAVALIPMVMFRSAALCSIIVVMIAAAVNLNLLPALLLKLSPLTTKNNSEDTSPSRSYKLWLSWTDMVMRKPLRTLTVVSLLLFVLLVPAFKMTTAVPDASSLPKGTVSRQADETLKVRFQMNRASEVLVVMQSAGSTFSSNERLEAFSWLKDIKSDISVISVKNLTISQNHVMKDPKLENTAVFRVTVMGEPGSVEVNQWLRDTEKKANHAGNPHSAWRRNQIRAGSQGCYR